MALTCYMSIFGLLAYIVMCGDPSEYVCRLLGGVAPRPRSSHGEGGTRTLKCPARTRSDDVLPLARAVATGRACWGG